MRGTILGVHNGRGVLLGPSDQRLEFPMSEWRSAGTPTAGQIVDFLEQNGEAHAVFAVPGASSSAVMGAPTSGSMVLSGVALVCLALGFLIPLLPTIAAFVLGVIAANQARNEGNETALLMARIAWIGAVVLVGIGFFTLLLLILLFGAGFFSFLWSGLGPIDF